MKCRKCGSEIPGPGGSCPVCIETYCGDGDLVLQGTMGDAPTMEPVSESIQLTVLEGKYEAVRVLGRGGMGVVYYGVDTTLDREVAIKVLAPECSENPVYDARFNHEAKTLAALDHPNIVPIYSYGQEGGRHYFVMKYIQGVDLAENSAFHKGDYREILPRLRPIFEALEHAHGKGVIHRDIKPANIIFTTDGVAMLLDFGISMDTSMSRLTSDGAIVGTPCYMSPEQAAGTHALSPASDQYSLGVILYEILAGAPPFVGDNPVSLLFRHVHETPEPIMEKNPAASLSVSRVVMKALAKDPADRFPSCMELYLALERALSEDASPEEAEPEAPTVDLENDDDEEPTRCAPLSTRKRPIRAAVAIMALAAAILLVGLWWSSPSREESDPPLAQPEPSQISISIETEPPGAEIFSGDTKLGVTPYKSVAVAASSARYRIVKQGFETYMLEVPGTANVSESIELRPVEQEKAKEAPGRSKGHGRSKDDGKKRHGKSKGRIRL